MSETRFFRCSHCGNIIGLIHDSGVPVVCCGEPMKELIPNTVEASQEKHLPVASVSDDAVTLKIGSAPHPMIPEHSIQWVYLKTTAGGHRKSLAPGEQPEVSFALKDEKPVAVYAYCNLHGLWMTKL